MPDDDVFLNPKYSQSCGLNVIRSIVLVGFGITPINIHRLKTSLGAITPSNPSAPLNTSN